MSWYSYDDARERKADLQLEIVRRRKKGEKFDALAAPQGNKKLVHSFWGKAWCQHLEKHSDYEYRLPRGRSYLRQGNVYNLEINPGKVTSTVAGSSFYQVEVTIRPLVKTHWQRLKKECTGQVPSLLDLLGGRLGDGVLRAITDPKQGLFPEPSEIRFSCSCPDWADLCKHVAATLYGVGVQLETKPELFFTLRSVDPAELLSTTAREALADVGDVAAALAGEDLGAMFGISMAEEEAPKKEKPKRESKRAGKVKKTLPKKAPVVSKKKPTARMRLKKK